MISIFELGGLYTDATKTDLDLLLINFNTNCLYSLWDQDISINSEYYDEKLQHLHLPYCDYKLPYRNLVY